MKAQDFIDYYTQEVDKIPEKFEKIKEVTRKWLYFDCFRLQLGDFSGYENLFYLHLKIRMKYTYLIGVHLKVNFLLLLLIVYFSMTSRNLLKNLM